MNRDFQFFAQFGSRTFLSLCEKKYLNSLLINEVMPFKVAKFDVYMRHLFTDLFMYAMRTFL